MKNLFATVVFGLILILNGCSDSPPPESKTNSMELPAPVKNAEASFDKPSVQATEHVAAESAEAKQSTAAKTGKVDPLTPAPDFTKAPAGAARKSAFFDYMVPLIQSANQDVLATRNRLQDLISQPKNLAQKDQAWLVSIAEKYGLDQFDLTDIQQRQELLKRVDEIPVSLALAQAANESAWGTSRFARKANNYYGQWCFSKGCGLVPKQRNKGAIHEVRAFDYPYDSIKSYIHNLNTHRTYKKLRSIRRQQRSQQQPLSGIKMAEGLVNYSQRKHEYVKELQSMIRYNNLERFNLKI